MGRDKEKKERKRDHQLWLQLYPAGVSRVLEHTWSKCTGLSGSTFVETSFPHLGNKLFAFYAIKLPCAVCSSRPFWKWAGRLWDLWSPSPPTLLAHFSTSLLHLCCTVLCLSPGDRSRIFVPEKCCPISSHILFFLAVWYYLHPLFVNTNSPWLGPQPFSYQCLRQTH